MSKKSSIYRVFVKDKPIGTVNEAKKRGEIITPDGQIEQERNVFVYYTKGKVVYGRWDEVA